MEKLLVSFTTVDELKENLKKLDGLQKIFAISYCFEPEKIIGFPLDDLYKHINIIINFFNDEVEKYDKEKYIFLK